MIQMFRKTLMILTAGMMTAVLTGCAPVSEESQTETVMGTVSSVTNGSAVIDTYDENGKSEKMTISFSDHVTVIRDGCTIRPSELKSDDRLMIVTHEGDVKAAQVLTEPDNEMMMDDSFGQPGK